jgi:hypothetical protein
MEWSQATPFDRREAAKNLAMQYRIERSAPLMQFVGLAVIFFFLVASIVSVIFPVHLAWRDGP